MSTKCSPNPL